MSPRRGQSLLELCLVLPLLLTILMAVVEFGFYFYTMANVNNAVRAAARAGASTLTSDTSVRALASNALGFQAGLASISLFEFTPATVKAANPALPAAASDVSGHPRTNGDYFVVQIRIPYVSMTKLVDLGSLAGITHYTDYATFPVFR